MTDNSNSDHDDTESEMQPLGTPRNVPVARRKVEDFVCVGQT